jgi:hypothetical protein
MAKDRLIPVTEAETTLLLEASIRHGSVHLTFGSRVCLVVKDSPWAVPLLLEWRGIMFDNGGGI